jgi:hypothetical protein
VVLRRRGGVYGDLAAEPEVRRLDWSDCGDGFAAKYGCACGWGRAVGTLHEKTCEVTAGESSAALRAWTVPAESQQEWRASLRSWTDGAGIMRCRS